MRHAVSVVALLAAAVLFPCLCASAQEMSPHRHDTAEKLGYYDGGFEIIAIETSKKKGKEKPKQ